MYKSSVYQPDMQDSLKDMLPILKDYELKLEEYKQAHKERDAEFKKDIEAHYGLANSGLSRETLDNLYRQATRCADGEGYGEINFYYSNFVILARSIIYDTENKNESSNIIKI